ncbi:MAG TPA: hypothetical protein VNK96_03205 [Fimbriimonadales bacterium]|nr:hypothetical protein [Fimbriimonadales bacterium]
MLQHLEYSKWISYKYRILPFSILCIVLLSLYSCTTEQKAVWIDWEKVQHAYTVPKSEFHLPAPEIYAPPVRRRVPSLVIQPRPFSGTEARRKSALELMESERMRIVRDLETAYLDRFMMEVEATKNKLLDQLHTEATQRIEALIEEVSQWIRNEAQEVGEIKLRLALIEGYPKPRPRNPEVLRKSAVERMWAEEAANLKRRLNALDESFSTKLQARLEKENIFWASEITRIEELVKKTRLEAQTAAKALAQQRIEETGRLQLPVLLDEAELQRESHPEIHVELQGLSVKPRWRETPLTPPPIDKILKTKLDIWLSVHGYKLAKSPEDGEDRTLEFIAWLNQNKVGH